MPSRTAQRRAPQKKKPPKTAPFERVLITHFLGEQVTCTVEGGTVFEAPTLLRRAARRVEEQLGGGE